MTKPLKLVAIGNSTGVVLPKDILSRLKIGQGDQLHVVETQGGLELRTGHPEFEDQMAAAREVMHRRRTALRELAK